MYKVMVNNYKYGKPISSEKMPRGRKRLPQYDECLREFLISNAEYWEVNLDSLPSRNEMVVLSSLKWRIKNNDEYKNIRVVMDKGKIFLERLNE
jgi:hypothetical protein